MRLRNAMMGLMLPLALGACAGNQNETGRATVDEVTDQPDNYIGRAVTVTGEIENVQEDRRVFTVEDHDWIFPENLLVVTQRPLSELMPGATADAIREDNKVRVSGTIHRLVTADMEREYDLDLEREFEVEFQERPILVANSIQLTSDQAKTTERNTDPAAADMNTGETGMVRDTTHPGATVPPPADSALLERDLPNVPPGDTIQDMNRQEMSGAGAAGAPVTDVLVIVPLPGPRDLIGKQVHLTAVPVQSQVGERGYWMGPTHTQQVFVRVSQNASNVSLTPGETASVWGTIQPVPSQSQIESEWQLESNLAEKLVRNEALYIKADSVKTSGS